MKVVGRQGICDSRGVVYDFQGPYTIVRGRSVHESAPHAIYQPTSFQKYGQLLTIDTAKMFQKWVNGSKNESRLTSLEKVSVLDPFP